MVFIAPGVTWDTTDLLTSVGLHTLIDNATVTAIAAGEFASDSKVINLSGTAPASPGDRLTWFDTALGLFRTYNDVRWDSSEVGAFLQNKHGSNLPIDTLVYSDPAYDNAYHTENAGGEPGVVGITEAGADDGEWSLVRRVGLTKVLVRGPIVRGDLLVNHGGAYQGAAQSATNLYGPDFTSGKDFGVALYQLSVAATTRMTCLIWR